MAGPEQSAAPLFHINWRLVSLVLVLAVVAATAIAGNPTAQAQTLTVLHDFTGGSDGAYPFAGITFDQQGRIYGTTTLGGSHQAGVVYRLVRQGEGWLLSPIYSFRGQSDGAAPYAGVVFGPDGLLYGTTYEGGAEGYGTVFSLRPPASACQAALCPWVESVIYSFTGGAEGADPYYGALSVDRAGNIYGTTIAGGSTGNGVVFQLSRSGSGWTESVLWDFTGHGDGGYPVSGVIFDNAGNLYGTTSSGGSSPPRHRLRINAHAIGMESKRLSIPSRAGTLAAEPVVSSWMRSGNLFGITGGCNRRCLRTDAAGRQLVLYPVAGFLRWGVPAVSCVANLGPTGQCLRTSA